jgi:uncharacterized protein (TIGR02588 family)
MRSRPGPSPSTAERITLVLSFLVVAALIAVALIEEVRIAGSEPTRLSVAFHLDRVTVQDESYFVPYTIENRGAQAIDTAQVRFEVLSGDSVVHSDEITIQFLPLDGIQTGVFVTPLDPATHTLRAVPVTIQYP